MTFLDGKVVIVTGAGCGLGAAYAMAPAEAGTAVMVNDVDADARTVQSITIRGGQAIADAANIATWSGVGSLVNHRVDVFGRIDGLVNNAGLYRLTASRVVRTSHPFSICSQSTSRARCAAAPTRCVTCLLVEPVPSSTSPQAPQPGSPAEHFMARPRPPCSRSPGPGRSMSPTGACT
jgi:NAD(P)-dependent dehydrogenase (short-subunit alcohol dehydrogenase family)